MAECEPIPIIEAVPLAGDCCESEVLIGTDYETCDVDRWDEVPESCADLAGVDCCEPGAPNEDIQVGYLLIANLLECLVSEELAAEIPAANSTEDERKCYKSTLLIQDELLEISHGGLRLANFCRHGTLYRISGYRHPILLKVRPALSSLSLSGVFIYDRRMSSDNRLYFFIGPNSPKSPRVYAEGIIDLMTIESPDSLVVRIDGDLTTDNFKQMIHEMGDDIGEVRPGPPNYSEMSFESDLLAESLVVRIFSQGQATEIRSQPHSFLLSSLPDPCCAIIDLGDDSLYVYVSSICSKSTSDLADRRNAFQWLNSEPRFKDRSPFIFDKGTVPLALAIMFTQPTYFSDSRYQIPA
jgi:hypothetical protein